MTSFLSPNALLRIYKTRLERIRLLMHKDIPKNIRLIIEAKVRLTGEFPDLLTRYISGQGKNTFAKNLRAKKMKVCHKCARQTCNTNCRSLDFLSVNHEDKINFIKDDLIRWSLYDMLLTHKTHPNGDVYITIHNLWPHFQREQNKYSLGNLTLKEHVCQFIKKLDGNPILDPQRVFKPLLDVKSEENVSHNHNYCNQLEFFTFQTY